MAFVASQSEKSDEFSTLYIYVSKKRQSVEHWNRRRAKPQAVQPSARRHTFTSPLPG